MLVDVIIPSKTSSIFFQTGLNCINSLRSSEHNHQFNVIIVESEPKETAYDIGQNLTIQYPKEEKFIYNKALNLGIKRSKSEWVVLSNNDVLFKPAWFTEILRVNELYPELKSFCSWCDYDNWHNIRYPDIKSDELFILNDWIGYGMASWTIIVKREVLDVIHLGEHVSFWYSDNVYADELRKYGYKHALAVRSKIDHLGSMTISTIKYDPSIDEKAYINGK
jgi:GT2 family glycosyltransferase